MRYGEWSGHWVLSMDMVARSMCSRGSYFYVVWFCRVWVTSVWAIYRTYLMYLLDCTWDVVMAISQTQTINSSNFCQAASECKCVQLSVFLLLCFLLFWFVCNWSAIYLYRATNASSVRRCWASILHWAQHNWGFPLVAKSWKMFNFR